MESRLSVDINRPIAEVFEYSTNNLAEWSITCVEDEVIEEKPGMVGTTFRVVTEDRGRRMVFQGVVTAHEPPHRNAVHLDGDQFDIDVEYLFEEIASGTRVTQHSVVRGKGFFKVFFVLMGWLMSRAGCKAQESELASLKEHCEARGATD